MNQIELVTAFLAFLQLTVYFYFEILFGPLLITSWKCIDYSLRTRADEMKIMYKNEAEQRIIIVLILWKGEIKPLIL